MGKTRVHLLAKELGLETKDLIVQLDNLGMRGHKAQTSLEHDEVTRIRAALAAQEKPQVHVGQEKVVAKPVVKLEIGTTDSGKPHKSDADFVIALLKSVQGILEKLESRDDRGVANWINDLERKNRIPKPVGMRMHGIRITRNMVIHEEYVLSPAERRALDADWAAIKEWWKDREIP